MMQKFIHNNKDAITLKVINTLLYFYFSESADIPVLQKPRYHIFYFIVDSFTLALLIKLSLLTSGVVHGTLCVFLISLQKSL